MKEYFLLFLILLLFLFGIFCIISSRREDKAHLWYYMLNITRIGKENIVNRTITFIVLRSSSEVYAVIPLITVLREEVRGSNVSYFINVCIFPLNYSARGVVGCGWYDFNISKLLYNLEYEDYLNITNLGPRLFNVKYRSGEVRSDGIYHGDSIFSYIMLGPGKEFNFSEASRLSWLAMYLTIKNPKVFMESGDVIVFPAIFRFKYVFIKSSGKWNALLFFKVLKANNFISIQLYREGEIYYLNLNLSVKLNRMQSTYLSV